MKWRRGVGWCSWSVVSGWLVACSDPAASSAHDDRFSSVCGQDGPVELLAMEADEDIASFVRIGGTEELHVRVKGLSDDPADVRLDAIIDECGAEVADLASPVSALEWRGGVLFGCIEDDLVWLTGYDDPSPTMLARQGCHPMQVGDYWVALDAEDDATVGRLVAIETEGSQVAARELVDDVAIEGIFVGRKTWEDELFVQTPPLSVQRVDPSTGAREPLLAQAAAGAWIVDGKSIVYQLPWGEGEVPTPLIVRDRQSGAEQIVEAGAPVDGFGWAADGLLETRSVRPLPEQYLERWFWSDPLRALDVPEGMQLLRQRDDDSFWLLRTDGPSAAPELLEWREGEAPQTVWSCPACRIVELASASEYFDFLVQTDAPVHHEVWRFETAGGPPLHLGSVMNSVEPVEDGRLLSVLVDEQHDHGPLMLSSGPDESAVLLAADAERRSIFHTRMFDRPGEVVYDAREDDGTSTLLRARLAP